MQPQKIAFHHLYSNGDCLFATIAARQLKTNYPESHITWYVASHCKGMIANNPDVDVAIEVDAKSPPGGIVKWHEVEAFLRQKVEEGVYDLLISTQIIGDNEKNYTGTIRSSVLKNFPYPITVSKTPYIYPTGKETERVKQFFEENQINKYKRIILFECQPLSGQVPITPVIATQISEQVLSKMDDTCFILTSGEKIKTENQHIYDASVLTIRENAELIKHCTHLVGCSSGISWLTISNQGWKIPMFQMLDNRSFYFNSMVRDFKYFNEDATHIIESRFETEEVLKDAVVLFLKNFEEAQKKYHVRFKDRSRTMYSLCRRHIVAKKPLNAISIIKNCFRLNRKDFRYYLIILKLMILFPLFLLMKKQEN